MPTYSWNYKAVESLTHDSYIGWVDSNIVTNFSKGSMVTFGPDELGGTWMYTITSDSVDSSNILNNWRGLQDAPGYVFVTQYTTGDGHSYRPYQIDLGGSKPDWNGPDGFSGLGSEYDKVLVGGSSFFDPNAAVEYFGKGYYVVSMPGQQGLVTESPQNGLADYLRFDNTTLTNSAMATMGMWHIVADGEFGGDAHPDLVTQSADGQIDFVYMDGGQVVGSLLIGGNYAPVRAAGRFSGFLQKDGLVTQDPVTHQIDILWFQGANLQASSLLQGTYDRVVAAADLDGDKVSEIITQNAAGQLDVLKFSGTQLTQASLLRGNYDPVVSLSNVNHDGSSPWLVTQNANTGAINELHFAVSFGANGADHLDASLALPGQWPVVNAGQVGADAWHLW